MCPRAISMTLASNNLTSLNSTKMTEPSDSVTTLLTTLYSNVWTTMASAPSKASTPTSASTFLTSLTPSTLPLSTSTSPLTDSLASHTADSINSTVPNATSLEETSTNSTMSPVLMEEMGRRMLDKIQEGVTLNLMPLIVFLAIIAVMSLLGNSMVLLVFSKRARRSTNEIFLMAIAVYDLLAGVVTIPVYIYGLLNAVKYDIPILCKFGFFINNFTCWTPAVILVSLAFIRYRQISKPPGYHTSPRTAMIIIIVISLACALLLSPYFKITGINYRPTGMPGVFVKNCYIDDDYVGTIAYKFYNPARLLMLLSICVALTVFYLLIGIKVWRQRKFRDNATALTTPITSKHTEGICKAWICCRRKKKCDITHAEDSSSDMDDGKEDKADIQGEPKGSQRKRDETKSVDESDACCTEITRLPSKDEPQVVIPMSEELGVSLNKNRDGQIHTDEDKETTHEAQSDTLTMAEKAKKDSIPLKEMESQSNTTTSSATDGRCRNNSTTFQEVIDETKGAVERSRNLKAKSHKKKINPGRRILGRTTLRLIIICAACIISFFPYVVFTTLNLRSPNSVKHISKAGRTIINILTNFTFVNNAVNAIIYCLCDVKFRNQVKKIICGRE